jgi:hypothetical protein
MDLAWFLSEPEVSILDMTLVEEKLLKGLVRLEEAVQSMPTANPKPNLMPIFEELDQLTAQLPKPTDPQLLHYLQKKSYQKARLFLQGRDAANQAGPCGHVH